MYLLIHHRLKEKYRNYPFDRKELCIILGKLYLTPKKLRDPIIKELKDFKLIKSSGLNKFEVIKNGFNINNTSKIFRAVGLY